MREAITTGQASAVNFRVKGELEHVPFEKPGKGEFHISAQVQDVNYQFVPGYLLSPGEKPWPPLTRLSGEPGVRPQLHAGAQGQGLSGSYRHRCR